MAVTLEETIVHTAKTIRSFGYTGQEDIPSFLLQPKYALYVRIPKHITAYLDHFGVLYRPKELSGALGVFYVWLKTVDDILDEDRISGEHILRAFDLDVLPPEAQHKLDEPFLTAAVSQLLGYPGSPQRGTALEHLYDLYIAARAEHDVVTAHDLITKRIRVGRNTSLLSLDIIAPYISSDSTPFQHFLVRAGEVGTLLDSALDFDRDLAANQFAFSSPSEVKRTLYFSTAKHALGLLCSYPFLLPHYLRGCFSIPQHTALENSAL